MGPDHCFQVTGIDRHALINLLSQVNNLTLKFHEHLLLSKKRELEKSLGSSSKVSFQQSLKSSCMAGFIPCRFLKKIMGFINTRFFRSQRSLMFASA